jgi:hypothetical protein
MTNNNEKEHQTTPTGQSYLLKQASPSKSQDHFESGLDIATPMEITFKQLHTIFYHSRNGEYSYR